MSQVNTVVTVLLLSTMTICVCALDEMRGVRHLFPRRTNDTRPERRHSEEFYQKVYKFISNTYQFGNYTYEVSSPVICWKCTAKCRMN